MTVGELLTRISGEELTEWMAYERMHGPLGPVRGDWQAARIAATVYAAAAGKKAKRLKIEDFMLKWAGEHKAATAADMEALARQLAAMYGGTWVEGSDDR